MGRKEKCGIVASAHVASRLGKWQRHPPRRTRDRHLGVVVASLVVEVLNDPFQDRSRYVLKLDFAAAALYESRRA